MFGYVSFSEAPFASLGGVSYAASVQELAQITEIVLGGRNYPAQTVEFWVAIDSPPSNLIISGAFCTDTINVSDQYSTKLDGFVYFSDTARPLDSLSSGTLSTTFILDTARPLDTVTPTSVFNLVVPNTALALDTLSTNNNQFFSLSTNVASIRGIVFAPQAGISVVIENASLFDSPSASSNYKSQVISTLEVSESITSVVFYLYPTLINESSRISVQVTAANLYLTRVHELCYENDSVTTNAALLSSVVDAAVYLDVITTQANIFISVFESSGIFDSIVSGTPYFASLSDTFSIGDVTIFKDSIPSVITEQAAVSVVVIGDSPWDPIDPSQNPVWTDINDGQNPNWTPVVDAQAPNWQLINDSQTVLWQNVDDAQTPNWQYIVTGS